MDPIAAAVRPRLLVVDDVPDITLIVRRLSQRFGHEVIGCLDAASAWAPLFERPDLVILDLNLPGESGLDLCRRIRATPTLADLPIALFSHCERPEDIVAGLESGIDYVLSKDLLGRPDQWQQRLHELLSPVDSRPYRRSLSWTVDVVLPVEHWLGPLNQALRQQVLRMGTRILVALLQRALLRTGLGRAADWFQSDGWTLDIRRIATGQSPERILTFTAAIAEFLWAVVGTTGSAPFRSALTDGPPALVELFADR
jgi:DNA-binding response OmpR family regulator